MKGSNLQISRWAIACWLLVSSLWAGVFAGDALKVGALDMDPPTLVGGGFEWWIDGDANRNATLQAEIRESGKTQWLPAPSPEYYQGGDISGFYRYKIPVAPHFVGSFIDLKEGTEYEVRLVFSDPDGVEGEAEKLVHFTTRSEPQPYVDGRMIEVYADADKGDTLEKILPDLKPGDRVRLHAGTYSPPALQASGLQGIQADIDSDEPQGEIRHVYPPKYKGPKEEPNFKSFNEAYHGYWWNADFMFQVLPRAAKPGDTIVLHAGTYKANRFDYRDPIGLWQHGTYYLTRKATAEKPITIKAAGDGEVILAGNDCYQLIDAEASEHHIIEGLTLVNAFIGIRAGTPGKTSAKGLEIRDCKIMDVQYGVVAGDEKPELVHVEMQEGAYPDRYEGTYAVAAKGTADKPITFEPAGDGEVIFDGKGNYCLFDVMAYEHLIFKGLTIRDTFIAFDAGRLEHMGAKGLTIKQCRLENIQHGILGLDGECSDFTIVDNVMLGRLPHGKLGFGGGDRSGYAVNLCGSGHSVGYNYADGFWDILNVSTSSTPLDGQRAWSMDFYNNDLRRGADNIFEIDGTMWNVRFMRNRCAVSGSFAFSSQNTLVGPSYYLRNILIGSRGSVLKGVRSKFFYALHNTTIGSSAGLGGDPTNNFISSGIDKIRSGRKNIVPLPEFFVKVPEEDMKSNWEDTPGPIDMTGMDFSLVDGAAPVDAGVVIPGINEDFTGADSDIGALEKGKPVPHYGPRK
jgi:hypothetical protein